MTSILRKYILGNEEIDSIVKSPFELKNKSIEDIVLEKFKPYYNQTIDSIGEKFNVDRGGKNYHNRIASAILNLKGKIKGNETFPKVDEFEKASIVVKTVKFNKNNINKESMSFPAFRFKDLIKEKWEDEDGNSLAQWHNFLLETRFLFLSSKKKKVLRCLKALNSFQCQKTISKVL